MNTSPVSAQQKDWQWIKRGGASIEGNERAHVYDIATDGDRNVYVVSPIGVYNLDIDGHPKTYYGGPGGTAGEYALASFACDGSYRWSKIIGGRGLESGIYIETDANDNLYVAGMFGSCNSQAQGGPPRIENDIILPGQTNTDCSLLFISKFDKNGNLLWFKRPMPQTTDVTDAYDGYSYNIEVDANGNIYWLIIVPTGTYANGAFTNTMPGRNFFILKYDSTGNFLNATYLDIQLSPGIAGTSLKMYRNPHNGYFYFTGQRVSNESATVGGQSVTGSFYLACFDGQGNFQWIRQNTYINMTVGSVPYGLDFDAQNNIYIGLAFLGFGYDSFLGYSVPEQIVPGAVMKTNPDATNGLWFSYNNLQGSHQFGDIVLNNNELAFTSWGYENLTWGSQTITLHDDDAEVLLARFDKMTGNCIDMKNITGNEVANFNDFGSALIKDANDDYLIGGGFTHILYYANGGSVINPSPGNPDFFIAKYATSPCPTMKVREEEKAGIGIWPNPVRDKLHVSTSGKTTYKLYALDGRLVKKGSLSKEQGVIGMKGFSSGVYLLELKNGEGRTKTLKVVKE